MRTTARHHEPTWTQHAKRRFRERFPGVNPADEWASAMTASGRVGRSRKRQLRQRCRGHSGVMGKSFAGYYYRIGRSGCVFVVRPPFVIVTVFQWRVESGVHIQESK